MKDLEIIISEVSLPRREITELSKPYFVQLTETERDDIVAKYGGLRQALMQVLKPVDAEI